MPGIPEFWIFGLWFTVGAFFVLRLQMCFFSSLIKTANKEIAKPAFKHFLNFSLSLNILSSLSSFNKWGCHMEKCANYCFASAGVAAGWDCGQRSSNHLGKFFTEGWSMSSATYFLYQYCSRATCQCCQWRGHKFIFLVKKTFHIFSHATLTGIFPAFICLSTGFLVSFADKETSGTGLSWELSAVLLCLMKQSS